jgi:hypothetical protein
MRGVYTFLGDPSPYESKSSRRTASASTMNHTDTPVIAVLRRALSPRAWIVCAALAAPSPSLAWDPAACQKTGNAKEFLNKLLEESSFLSKSGLNATIIKIGSCRNKATAIEQTQLDTCVSRVKNYADVILRKGLGLNKSNAEFLAEFHSLSTTTLDIPKALRNQQLFDLLQQTNLAKEDSVKSTVDKIKDLLPDALVVPYVSPTTPSIDNVNGNGDTRGRIVVWANDSGVSKYIQFSVNANLSSEGKRIHRTQASVVSVKREDPNKGTYIFDWQRSIQPSPPEFNYNEEFGNDQHCYGCHASGVLAIRPFTGDGHDVADAAQALGTNYSEWLGKLNTNPQYKGNLEKLNKQMSDDWKAVTTVAEAPTWMNVDPIAVGPNTLETLPSGQPNETATFQKAITDACKGELDAVNTVSPKGCNGCHAKRGKPLFDQARYTDMIRKYVQGGYMPPNAKVSDAAILEKMAACFITVSDKLVKDWLKGSCN